MYRIQIKLKICQIFCLNSRSASPNVTGIEFNNSDIIVYIIMCIACRFRLISE